jgi:hypothetical protein
MVADASAAARFLEKIKSCDTDVKAGNSVDTRITNVRC